MDPITISNISHTIHGTIIYLPPCKIDLYDIHGSVNHALPWMANWPWIQSSWINLKLQFEKTTILKPIGMDPIFIYLHYKYIYIYYCYIFIIYGPY